MPEYLSPEWIEALDTALRSSSVRAATPFEMETVVRDGPLTNPVRYRIRIDERGASAGTASTDDPAPDLRLTTDYPTALAIASGAENAQVALAAGRLQLGGDVNVLIGAADLLAGLDDASATLRTRTTYRARDPVGSPPDVG